MITTEEYRRILGDMKSTEEQIKERLSFLEAFCKNIIRSELENYVRSKKEKRKSAPS